jgi:hypothetical protein
MTRDTMKLDIKNKSLFPAKLYATGTVAAIIELAKYYNGKPTESPLIKEGDHKVVENFGGASSVKKVFLFYRAYTK